MVKYVTNWDKYPNFREDEFKCPHCGSIGDGISESLVDALQYLRTKYGVGITITSGYRCKAYNDSLTGSSKTSKHLTGQAADFVFADGRMSNQSTRVALMNEIKQLDYFRYTYCNINGNHPNMGSAIHMDFNFKEYNYNGYLDSTTKDNAIGWAYNGLDDDILNIEIDIYKDGIFLETVLGTAGQDRLDLINAKIGNGYHGFNIELNLEEPGTYNCIAYCMDTNNHRKSLTLGDKAQAFTITEIIIDDNVDSDVKDNNTDINTNDTDLSDNDESGVIISDTNENTSDDAETSEIEDIVDDVVVSNKGKGIFAGLATIMASIITFLGDYWYIWVPILIIGIVITLVRLYNKGFFNKFFK